MIEVWAVDPGRLVKEDPRRVGSSLPSGQSEDSYPSSKGLSWKEWQDLCGTLQLPEPLRAEPQTGGVSSPRSVRSEALYLSSKGLSWKQWQDLYASRR